MPEGVPVQKVVELRNKGADNNKIIEALRSENYSFQQIRDAIQQADIKKSVAEPKAKAPPSPVGTPAPTPKPVMQAPAPAPSAKPAAPTPMPQPMPQKPGVDLDEIQRVLEEIISEKWRESEKVINDLNEWRAVVNTKIKDFDTRMSEFNSRIEALNTVLGQKAEAFNDTMSSVDTELKALEKALNRLVPTLSDNISELKSIVSGSKKE